MQFYVGCGSSSTPEIIVRMMRALSGVMSDKGVTLRTSEHSDADQAFIRGSKGKFYTFLPFSDPEIHSVWGIPSDVGPNSAYVAFARKLVPGFVMLPIEEKRWEIVANSLVYGSSGTDKARMLICWTEDGAVCPSEFTPNTGHVARYIKVAHAAGVPIFNLQRPDHLKKLMGWLKK